VLVFSPPFPSPLLRPPGRPAARHPARPVRPRGRASQHGGLDARRSRVWGSADPRGAEPQTRTSRLGSRAVCPVPASGPGGLAVGRPAGRAGLLGVVVRRRLLAVVAVRGWWSWVSVVAGCRVVAVWAFWRCGVCGCAGRSCVAVVGWSVNRLGLGRTPAARGVLGRAAGKGPENVPGPAGTKMGAYFDGRPRGNFRARPSLNAPHQNPVFPRRPIQLRHPSMTLPGSAGRPGRPAPPGRPAGRIRRPGSKRVQMVWGSHTRLRARSHTMTRRVGPGPSASRWSGGPILDCGPGPIR